VIRTASSIALLFACTVAHAADLPAWLAGHWTTSGGKTTTEEMWLAPASGLMVGVSRTVGGKAPFFEFIRIEARGDAIVFVAQPRGVPPTEFAAIKVEADAIVFENPTHDFPQRIVYRRAGDDRIDARIEGKIGDKARSEDWRYERVKAAGTPSR
jgi:hypothetical protein